MNNETWKVYKLVSPTDRVYIGCTKLPLEKRWEKGSNYKHNKELFDDIVLYGWENFLTFVIAQYTDEAEAREREHSEIQNYPNGYNIYRGEKQRPKVENPLNAPKQVMCVETGVIYESIKEAARQTGLCKQKISYCCRGIRYKKTGGYHWKFV